ncbi:MAG: acyl-CoA thioesterase [Campylobacter sp.]|nr:acyl-CoA thioesterase [Campylobacter sp.]
MIEFWHKIRVEFYDVDSMDVVWHGNYVKFIEAVRCEFLRELGYDYSSFKNDGIVLPIVKMDFKFIKPAKFGDILDIRLMLEDYVTTLKIKYEIYANNELICKANTAQAYVDYNKTLTLFEIPNGFLNALKARYEI